MKLGWSFAALCSVPFVMVLSNSMLIPVLPQIQQALDTSFFRVSLLLTAFSIPAGLVIPFSGMASDHWGRKTVLIPALVLFGLGGLLAGIAPLLFAGAFSVMIAARILQGIGGGGTYQVAMALAGDLYRGQRRARAMGILEASNGLGKVVSPILGSAAALLAWNAPFYVYPLLAWLSAAGVWLWVSESEAGRRARPFREYVRELGRIFADRGVALAVAFFMGAAVLFMLFGVLSWYSDVLERPHGITGFTKGFVIAVPVLVMAVTSWLTGTYLTERLRRWLKHVAIGGMGLIATALATLYAVRGPVPLTLVVSLLGFGNGLVLPVLNTLITSAAATGERGLVTSLYGTVRFFGAALGPPAFGLLLEAGPLWMFWGSAAVVALIALAGAFWLDAARLLRAGTQPSGRAAAGGTRGRQNRKPPAADAQATRPKPDEPREPDNQRVEPQPELAGRR